MKVLVVGCDLSSSGGIASVVKMFNGASKCSEVSYGYVKTTNYKDSGLLGNLFAFVTALLVFWKSVFCVDLVHVQGSSHASFYREFVFVVFSKFCFKPVVWNFHASRFEDFFGRFYGFSYRFKRWALRWPDCIVVLAEKYKSLLEEGYFLANVLVLRNPAILDHSSLNPCRDIRGRLNVLFVGFFIDNKGVLDLLAVAELSKAEAGFKFYFAGKGELEEEIKVAQLDDPDTVELIGWLDEAGKLRAYHEADVLVLPSYREGMPIVILEAMASGLPVIATNIAAIPEQIKDAVGGLLYEAGDTEGLMICLDRMRDSGFRKSCSVVSLRKVQHFSVERVFEDLVNIYKAVLR